MPNGNVSASTSRIVVQIQIYGKEVDCVKNCNAKDCYCCQRLTKLNVCLGLGVYLAIIVGIVIIAALAKGSVLIHGRMVGLINFLIMILGVAVFSVHISITSRLTSYFRPYASWIILVLFVALNLIVPIAHICFLITGENAMVLPIGMATEPSAVKVAKEISASFFAKATSAADDDSHILVSTPIGDVDVLIRSTKPEMYIYHLMDDDSKLVGHHLPARLGDWSLEESVGNAALVCKFSYYPACNVEKELARNVVELINQLVAFHLERTVSGTLVENQFVKERKYGLN